MTERALELEEGEVSGAGGDTTGLVFAPAMLLLRLDAAPALSVEGVEAMSLGMSSGRTRGASAASAANQTRSAQQSEPA